ncbi:MAG: hypothetical protein QOJ79_1254 [Actinomycetota bacterium]|jgi:hypothetical protein|nr:hypothetical protein [Actinomycetota bacterium]
MAFPDPLPIGCRVRVRRDPDFGPGPWPDEPLGTIVRVGDEEHFSLVETRRGSERSYWVRFDKPQRDAGGDGPYSDSQVLERYLEVSL